MKKIISFEENDFRPLTLQYCQGFPYSDIILNLKQIDILRIIIALEKTHNKSIIFKLKKFIEKIDKAEGVDTNYERQIPRRNPK